MATIKAGWKRVIQVKPYETETLELGIEDDSLSPGDQIMNEVEALSRELSTLGDRLIAERMAKREHTINTSQGQAVIVPAPAPPRRHPWLHSRPEGPPGSLTGRETTSSMPRESTDWDPLSPDDNVPF